MTTEERLAKVERELAAARRRSRWLLVGLALGLGALALVWASEASAPLARAEDTASPPEGGGAVRLGGSYPMPSEEQEKALAAERWAFNMAGTGGVKVYKQAMAQGLNEGAARDMVRMLQRAQAAGPQPTFNELQAEMAQTRAEAQGAVGRRTVRANVQGIPTPDFSQVPAEPVARIIDGDTITVVRGGLEVKVRLIGVDTPETVHPSKPVEVYGKEASRFTTNLLQGEMVYLVRDSTSAETFDRYGRLLAFVYRAPDGLFVNAEIVRQGYGHAYVQYPFRYMEKFRALEHFAREAGKGLWGAGAESKNAAPGSVVPSPFVIPCPFCQGSGKCTYCNGTGRMGG